MLLDDHQRLYLSQLRRKLHALPEPGFLEINTANELYHILKSLNFDLEIGEAVMDNSIYDGKTK